MDGNVGALRHFLRVAPERVDEKYPATGRRPQKTSVELLVPLVLWVEGARR